MFCSFRLPLLRPRVPEFLRLSSTLRTSTPERTITVSYNYAGEAADSGPQTITILRNGRTRRVVFNGIATDQYVYTPKHRKATFTAVYTEHTTTFTDPTYTPQLRLPVPGQPGVFVTPPRQELSPGQPIEHYCTRTITRTYK